MGETIIASAYDGPQITVSEMLKDPTWIPTRVLDSLEGQFLSELIFRNGGSNQGVVAFHEAASPFLDMDAQEVAEFAEIPVAGITGGKMRSIVGVKTALAIRVSREMLLENRVDQVALRTTALRNTMIRSDVRSSLAAFTSDESAVPTVAAGSAWGAGGDPVEDILGAVEKIQSAENERGQNFEYDPDTLVLHPLSLTKLTRHEQVQKYYTGDLASENPVYTGVKPQTLFGLQVAVSRKVPANQAFVMESGTVGFYSDTDPLQATPMYEEGGASGAGGPRQTWRSDMWRKRILAVDNPKAAVILTGVS